MSPSEPARDRPSAEEPQARPSRPRKGCGGCSGKLFGVGLLLMAILVIAWYGWRTITHNRLQAQLAVYRANGVPFRAEDVASIYPQIPDQENNTSLYFDACAPLVSDRADQQLAEFATVINADRIPGGDADWPEVAAAKSLVDEYQTSLEHLHQAARNGGRAWLAVDLTDSPGLDQESLQMLRRGFQLLNLELCVRANSDDAKRMTEPMIAMLKFSNATSDLPTDQQLGLGWDQSAMERLADSFQFSDYDAASLAEMQSELESMDLRARLQKWMHGHRMVGHQFFVDGGNFRQLDDAIPLVGRRDLVSRFSPFVHEDHLYYLGYCDRMQQALEAGWAGIAGAVNSVEQEHLDRMRENMGSLKNAVSKDLVPGLSGYVRSAVELEMWRRLLIVALAIKRFEIENGRLPAHLTDLIPRFLEVLPVDLNTGEAFNFLNERESFAVYSIGANKRDEYARGGDDIVLRIRKRKLGDSGTDVEKID